MIKVNNKLIEQGHFPDNTLHLVMEDFNNGGGFMIEWLYENDSELFTLICISPNCE